MTRSTYSYVSPRDEWSGVGGHCVEDGIHGYLFHHGLPITATGCWNAGAGVGWHCYHWIDGYEGGKRRDVAETLLDVNLREPRFTP